MGRGRRGIAILHGSVEEHIQTLKFETVYVSVYDCMMVLFSIANSGLSGYVDKTYFSCIGPYELESVYYCDRTWNCDCECFLNNPMYLGMVRSSWRGDSNTSNSPIFFRQCNSWVICFQI